MPTIRYTRDYVPTADEFIAVLKRSTLGERRPVDDRPTIEAMLKHANLLATAWDGDRLVGVARAVTDFAFCCYLSDLAVDSEYQRRGIGRELISVIRAALEPNAKMILLAAPKATGYYPRLGFKRHESAWLLSGTDELL